MMKAGLFYVWRTVSVNGLTARKVACAIIIIIQILLNVPVQLFSGFAPLLGISRFTPKLEIDIEDGEGELVAGFTIVPSESSLNFAKETISVKLSGGTAHYDLQLPSGTLRRDKSGVYQFRGIINGVKLLALLRPVTVGRYEFEIITEGANLRGMANPVTVLFSIGTTAVEKSLRAKIE